MQWGHIKTLFILSFLLLNIYLAIEFVEKQNAANMSVMDNAESTIEEQLASENINVEAKMEMELTEASYTEVAQKTLTDKDLSELGKFEDQMTAVINNNFIVSAFEEPIPLSAPFTYENISSEVKSHLLYADEYELWSWNSDFNILIFFQHRQEHPVYFNQNGLVLVYLNEENEMTHYTQTILGEGEAQGGAKTLLQPMQAIGSLYNKGNLRPEETITDVSLGYYARIATEGVQVFAPTWKVTIVANDQERNYFVNAIEGLIFESDNTAFLTDVLEEQLRKINTLDKDSEVKRSMLEQLNERLEKENRSVGE